MIDVPTSPGGPFVVDERYGSGVINGVPLVCPAWYFDLLPLWVDSPDTKGGIRDIPGQPGGVALPQYPAPTDYTLKGAVNGFVEESGVQASDPWFTLEQHVFHLRENVCDPRSAANGTYDSLITLPSGRIIGGPVTPLGMKSADGGAGPIIAVQFKLRVPAGVLSGRAATAAPSGLALASHAGTVTHP